MAVDMAECRLDFETMHHGQRSGARPDHPRHAKARARCRNAVHVYRLEAFRSRGRAVRPRTISGRLISLGLDQNRRHYSMPQPRRRRHGPQPDRRRALELLAASHDGATEAIMLAHGFTVELLVELIRAGLATATAERLAAGERAMEVARVRITEAGRQVLADKL